MPGWLRHYRGVEMVAATYFEMSRVRFMVLTILMGFVLQFGLGIIPLLRTGFSISRTLKIVFVAERLGIAETETSKVLTS